MTSSDDLSVTVGSCRRKWKPVFERPILKKWVNASILCLISITRSSTDHLLTPNLQWISRSKRAQPKLYYVYGLKLDIHTYVFVGPCIRLLQTSSYDSVFVKLSKRE